MFAGMVVWAFVSVFLVIYSDLDAVIALLLLGLLVARNFTDDLLTRGLRQRLDMFIYPGVGLFIVCVGIRAWKILSDLPP